MSENCPSMYNCPLYPLFKSESTLKVFKLRYCMGKFNNCERRIRAFAEEIIEVPNNLLPNGELLGESKRTEP